METTYQLTQRDFRESLIAHRNRSFLSKWLWRLAIGAVLLVNAFLLLGVIVAHDTAMARNLAPLFALSIGWIVFMLGLPWWSARRQFRGQPGVQGAKSLTLDEAGAHWRWSDGSSDVAWRHYARAVEGKNHFLLYTSPVYFTILPKRALTPDQLEQVRQLLNQKIPNAR